jgi:hypothetical protein
MGDVSPSAPCAARRGSTSWGRRGSTHSTGWACSPWAALSLGPARTPCCGTAQSRARKRLRAHLPREGPMSSSGKRVRFYTPYEQIWHWVQAAAVVALLVTGFLLAFPSITGEGFRTAVEVHHIFAVSPDPQRVPGAVLQPGLGPHPALRANVGGPGHAGRSPRPLLHVRDLPRRAAPVRQDAGEAPPSAAEGDVLRDPQRAPPPHGRDGDPAGHRGRGPAAH